MAAYFYSFKIISKFGHIKVLALGLLCNVIRFIYISFITWPWLILPIEIVQGMYYYRKGLSWQVDICITNFIYFLWNYNLKNIFTKVVTKELILRKIIEHDHVLWYLFSPHTVHSVEITEFFYHSDFK